MYLLGDSGAYDPLIIFLKGAICNVFDTILPSIYFVNIPFLYRK